MPQSERKLNGLYEIEKKTNPKLSYEDFINKNGDTEYRKSTYDKLASAGGNIRLNNTDINDFDSYNRELDKVLYGDTTTSPQSSEKDSPYYVADPIAKDIADLQEVEDKKRDVALSSVSPMSPTNLVGLGVREGLSRLIGNDEDADKLNELSRGVASQSKSYYTAKDARERLEAVRRQQEVADRGGLEQAKTTLGNLGQGMVDKARDLTTWDFGIGDASIELNLLNSVKNALAGDNLLPEEQEAIELIAKSNTINQEIDKEVPISYSIGAGTVESLPYMIGFASGIARNIATNVGGGALKKVVGKGVAEGLGKVVGAGAQTLSVGAPRLAEDVASRQIGDIVEDSEGNITQTEEVPLGEAIAKGIAAGTITNFSELTGSYFKQAGNLLGKVGGKIASNTIGRIPGVGKVVDATAEAFDKFSKTPIINAVTRFQKAAEFDGVLEEYLEEQTDFVLNSLIVGDQDISKITDAQHQLTTIGQVALMGGLFSAGKVGGYYSSRSKAKSNIEELTANIEDQDIANLAERVKESKSASERAATIWEYVKNNPTANIRPVVQIMNNLNFIDGYTIANEDQVRTPDRQYQDDIFLAYEEGKEISPNRAVNDHNKVRERFTEEQLAELDAVDSPMLYMDEKGTADNYSDITDFFLSRSRVEGAQSPYMQEAKTQIAEESKMVSEFARVDDATLEPTDEIIPVRLYGEDKSPRFIRRGVIARKEDGSLDIANSSDMFVLYDPQTKQSSIEHIDSIEEVMATGSLSEMVGKITEMHTQEQLQRFMADSQVKDIEQQEAEEQVVFEQGQPLEVGGVSGVIQQVDENGRYILSFDRDVQLEEGGEIQSVFSLSEEEMQRIFGYKSTTSSQEYGEYEEVDSQAPGEQSQGVAEGSELVNVASSSSPARVAPVNNSSNDSSTLEQEVTEPTTAVAEEVTAEPQSAEPIIPRNKQGEIEFDKIEDSNIFATALQEEFGDDVELMNEIVDEYLTQNQKALDSLKRTADPIKRARSKRKLTARRAILSNVKAQIAPSTATSNDNAVAQQEVSNELMQGWDNVQKELGATDSITLEDGSVITGQWTMVEPTAIIPSHDPDTLQPMEGFPTTAEGTTINDNDYSNKRGDIEIKAVAFDSRAIDNPIVVQDGIVLSGNNRAMSSLLAHRRGTDNKYRQELPNKAKMRGFSEEQIAQFDNPRLVFVVDESSKLPMTSQSFARFNQPATKPKTLQEIAKNAKKSLTNQQRSAITSIINGYENMKSFYASEIAQPQVLAILLQSGIMNTNDARLYFDGGQFTSAGQDLLESILIGNIVDENKVEFLNRTNMHPIRQKLVKYASKIAELAKINSSILEDINRGIQYIEEANRVSGGNLEELVRQQDIFDPIVWDVNGILHATMLSKPMANYDKWISDMEAYLADSDVADLLNEDMDVKQEYYNQVINQLEENEREIIRRAKASSTTTADGTADSIEQPTANVDGGNEVESDTRSVGETQADTDTDTDTDNGSGIEIDDTLTAESEQKTISKIVSDEQLSSAYEELRKLRNRMSLGIDPDLLRLGTIIAIGEIERGAVKFAQYVKAVKSQLGDSADSFLKFWYNSARIYPGFDKASEMDSQEYVDNYDLSKTNANKLTETTITQIDEQTIEDDLFSAIEVAEKSVESSLLPKEEDIKTDEFTYVTSYKNGKYHVERYAQSNWYPIVDANFNVSAQSIEELMDILNSQNIELSAIEQEKLKNYEPINTNDYEEVFVNEQSNDTSLSSELARELPISVEENGDRNETTSTTTDSNIGDGGSNSETTVASQNDNGAVNGSVVGNSSSTTTSDGGDVGGVNERGGVSKDSQGDRQSVSRNKRNNRIGAKDILYPKTPLQKFNANIEAIQLAKKLKENGKLPTAKEKKLLQQYTGWGGLSQMFNNYEQNKQLREVLTDGEYRSVKSSTLTSFYTPREVIENMWQIAESLGFKGGKVLEPSAGVGHILGLMPKSIANVSDISAIEYDDISGLIMELLYPDANPKIGGYEDAVIPNNSLDLVITNVPFGQYKLHDSNHKQLSSQFKIHDFFIAKSMLKLKPGGLGIFVSTSSTLDKSTRFRNWLVTEGNSDIIGAFRLNSNTFSDNANTNVTSDIIVIQKRDGLNIRPNAVLANSVVTTRTAEYEVETSYYEPNKVEIASMIINEYFAQHPENIGGEMAFGFEGGDSRRPTQQWCKKVDNIDQSAELSRFANSFEDSSVSTTDMQTIEREESLSVRGNVKEGELVVINDVAYIIQQGKPVETDWRATKVKGKDKNEVAKDYISIKNTLNELINAEMYGIGDIEALRSSLNRVYDEFVAKYGYLSENRTINFLNSDIDFPTVSAIENVNKNGVDKGEEIVISKSNIFNNRTIYPNPAPQASNIKDAVTVSIYQKGQLDINYIAELLSISTKKVVEDVLDSGIGFVDPISGIVVAGSQYLSGNVRRKLQDAEIANNKGLYDNNIAALRRVMPVDIPLNIVSVSVGASWVPVDVYESFMQETFNVTAKVESIPSIGFKVNVTAGEYNSTNRALGTSYKSGTELFSSLMQNRPINIYHPKQSKNDTAVLNQEATLEARSKAEEIQLAFQEWVTNVEQPFYERLTALYNDIYNSVVIPSYNIDFEKFPNATDAKILRPHQKLGVMRALNSSVLLAHQVGTGKTLTLITAAMEMKRLGLANKPMIVVQKATFGQFAKEIREIYPAAKILVPSAKDLKADQRRNLFAKIAYNDWDIVVIYHSYLDSIPDNIADTTSYISSEIEAMEDWMLAQSEESLKDKTIKEIERKIKRRTTELEKLLDRKVDESLTFDKLGVDALLIDEAHNYKKLGFTTSQQNVKGIDTTASQKALSLKIKMDVIQRMKNGRNIVLATGTPISNTMAEMWTFLRYLLPSQEIEDYGIAMFDDFVANFGSIEESGEFSTSGKWKVSNRFKSYANVPELLNIWRRVADVVLTEEVSALQAGVGTPLLENGKPTDIIISQSSQLQGVMKSIRQELEAFENMSGKAKKENSHIPLVMFGLAKRAAIDTRLVLPNLPADANSKLSKAVDILIETLEETASYNGTMAVFADSFRSSDGSFNLFDEIKAQLVARGVAEKQIAIINNYKTDKSREDLFQAVNDGKVRVIMGSTEKLGTGVNIQTLLHTVIHMDAPARPSDYEQRNGRIIRQGNRHLIMDIPVRIIRLGVEKTLDVTGYQRLAIKDAFVKQVISTKDFDVSQRELEEADNEAVDSSNFSAMMATLSGSQAAMAFQTETAKLKKLRMMQNSHEVAQLNNKQAIKSAETKIRITNQMLEKMENTYSAITSNYPSKSIDSVSYGGKTAKDKESITKLLAPIAKMVDKAAEELKSDPMQQNANMKFNIVVNGVELPLIANVTKQLALNQSVKVFRNYSVDILNNVDNEKAEVIIGADLSTLYDKINTYVSEFEENQVESRKRGISDLENGLEILKKVDGKPFAKKKELDATEAKLAQLEEQMKKELEEQEAEDAESGISSIEIRDGVVVDDDNASLGTMYRKKGSVRQDSLFESTSIETDKAEIAQEVSDLAESLGEVVEIVEDMSQYPNIPSNAKGWYDPATGKVYFSVQNAESVDDAIVTILHEVVGHKGLIELLGDKFTTAARRIYDSGTQEFREMIDGKGLGVTEGVAEYMAELAEKGVETKEELSTWQSIKYHILSALAEFKSRLSLALTESDIKYLLWKSYNNMQARAKKSSPQQANETIADFDIKTKNNINGPYLRRRGVDQIEKDEMQRQYDDRINTLAFKFREGHQDYMLGVLKIQRLIEAKLGRPLYDYENPYIAEWARTSIAKDMRNIFERSVFVGVADAIAKIEKEGASYDTIIDYLYSKTGLERNEVMARRNAQSSYDADLQELAKAELSEKEYAKAVNELPTVEDRIPLFDKDYSGLTAVTKSDSDFKAIAENIVAEFEADHDVKGIWSSINNVTTTNLNIMVKSGLISKEQAEAITAPYAYYMPLRDFDETVSSDVYEYLDSSSGNGVNLSAAVKGRTSRAADPLANLLRYSHAVVSQSTKNNVKTRLYNLAKSAKSPILQVQEQWYRLDDADNKYYTALPDIPEKANVAEVEAILNEFEATMKELEAEGKAHKGKTRPTMPYKISPQQVSEHIVRVKIAGTSYNVIIVGNPNAAQAINGRTRSSKNIDNAIQIQKETANWYQRLLVDMINSSPVDLLQRGLRSMAANYTARNPDFVFANMVKDFMFANNNTFIKYGAKRMAKFFKNWVISASSLPSLIAKDSSNKLDMDKKLDKMFNDFLRNGGETGYDEMFDFEKSKKSLKKLLKKSKQELYEPWAKTMLYVLKSPKSAYDAIGQVGRYAEMISRFAAFMESREEGNDINTAIYDAKEISVNFNKKGRGTKGGKFMNFMYVFYNAAIQGFATLISHFGYNPIRASVAYGGWIAAGILNAYLLYSGGDDDDEQENEVPVRILKHNIVMPGINAEDKNYGLLPLPIEGRAFFGAGVVIEQFMSGKIPADELAWELMGQAGDLLPIDYLGPAGLEKASDLLVNMSPSIARPFAEVVNNRNYFGYPISKQYDYNEKMPEFTKAYRSVNPMLVSASEAANEYTGGNKYRKGAIDINPANVEHVARGYLGGLFTFGNKLYNTAFGEDKLIRNMPIISRFAMNLDEYPSSNSFNEEYYEIVDMYEQFEQERRGWRSDIMKIANPIDKAEAEVEYSKLVNSEEMGKMQEFKEMSSAIKKLTSNLKSYREYMSDMDVSSLEKQIEALKQEAVENFKKEKENEQ